MSLYDIRAMLQPRGHATPGRLGGFVEMGECRHLLAGAWPQCCDFGDKFAELKSFWGDFRSADMDFLTRGETNLAVMVGRDVIFISTNNAGFFCGVFSEPAPPVELNKRNHFQSLHVLWKR